MLAIWAILCIAAVFFFLSLLINRSPNRLSRRWAAAMVVMSTGGVLNCFTQHSPGLVNLADALEFGGGLSAAILAIAILLRR